MTLRDILEDIHALMEDLHTYERKYGVLSETFYEAYQRGEEPENEAWALDWADWAGAYKLYLRRLEQYRKAIEQLRHGEPSLMPIIEKTARHEPVSVTS